MEWVETTGKTIGEAKEAALDQLGVDESDAEFQILEEPRGGLFGRLRSEARVRARVQPTKPPPKLDRRDRRRRGRRQGGKQGEGTEQPAATTGRPATARAPAAREVPKRKASRSANRTSEERDAMVEGPSLEEQARVVEEFIDGLVGAFGFDASTTASSDADDDAVGVAVDGDDLGLLIGPRGQTLDAIQELSRTVLQRATVGAPSARVRIDVGGYRERRREALERFALEIAEQVRESGARKALEPMGSADRKVVHDAVNELDGVTTTSEGVEPRRRVVILPEGEGD